MPYTNTLNVSLSYPCEQVVSYCLHPSRKVSSGTFPSFCGNSYYRKGHRSLNVLIAVGRLLMTKLRAGLLLLSGLALAIKKLLAKAK